MNTESNFRKTSKSFYRRVCSNTFDKTPTNILLKMESCFDVLYNGKIETYYNLKSDNNQQWVDSDLSNKPNDVCHCWFCSKND